LGFFECMMLQTPSSTPGSGLMEMVSYASITKFILGGEFILDGIVRNPPPAAGGLIGSGPA